jgi:response regulator RpfG family c-di-GMP phosphodiesterase
LLKERHVIPGKRVLSIGQCAADHAALARVLVGLFAAEVLTADTINDGLAFLAQEGFDLILVNRLLDCNGTSGVEVIKQLKRDKVLGRIPVMLVSNYEEAQREAMREGAEPGFGKAALGQPAMLGRVRSFLI